MSLFMRYFLSLLLITSLVGTAQALDLDTTQKRYSYVLGKQFAQQWDKRGIKVDLDAFTAAFNDVVQGNNIQMNGDEMRAAMQDLRQEVAKVKKAEADALRKAGEDFLEKNKSQPGVVVLPSGLQYIEREEGEGESPKPRSKVTVHYRGTLINGEEFDSSYSRGKPASFKLGDVIQGFSESILMMKPGAKWTIYVPSDLGYGMSGASSGIGPYETLIFDIELISVD